MNNPTNRFYDLSL